MRFSSPKLAKPEEGKTMKVELHKGPTNIYWDDYNKKNNKSH